ncbi:MAG: hypothetical protein HY020_12685 [Burkholderiales bacterium]|nr:hypothetical protein [Burkholderiales bacterium]
MQFSLRAAAAVTQAPFSLGFAFKKGDVPSGSSVSATTPAFQVVIKNRWPDGSAKFAVLSGLATVSASTPLVLALSKIAAPSTTPTALSTAQLKATAATATIDAGGLGSATWSGSDWDTPFSNWIAGPQMSSWIFRKRVGTDAHLVAWLEVRLYANGALEVLPWIENGYLRVASPTNKQATYKFSLGGSQRFSRDIDLPHHCRTPLVDGQTLSYWLASDPGVIASQDSQYLQQSELVPSYYSRVAAGADVMSTLPSAFVPLQQGNYPNAMGQTAYQPAIGLLPEWDVLFLTADDVATAYRSMLRNAFSAGRYPIHYRDENTNRPLRFSDYPYLSVNSSTKQQMPPTGSGTASPAWDIPHHPSVGYMAYLATGSWYFLEELQFAATYNYLSQTDNYRQFGKGIFLSISGASTVRGAAWGVRTLAQAAVATPDGDTLRSEMLDSLSANVEFNYSTYVAQPNNPFGFVAPYGDYGPSDDGKVLTAGWQQDFYTAAFGYALAMQPGVSATTLSQLSAFFAWKAQSIIGRLGGTASTEWLYRDAALYTLAVATTENPDWLGGTGPWPANWGVLYQASLGVANPGQTGALRGGNFPDGTSYWGNLMPALSYAVRHAVPGASAAMARVTGASNWSSLLTSFNAFPVWGVKAPSAPGAIASPPLPPVPVVPTPAPPAAQTPAPSPAPAPTPAASAPPASPAEAATPPVATLPAWAKGLAAWQWAPIAGTALSKIEPNPRPLGITGPSAKIDTWCGASLKRKGSVYMLGAAGGHADYAGNEVNALDLLADQPAWAELRGPSATTDLLNKTQFYLDNRPAASHTYYASQFIDRLNRLVVFPSAGLNGSFPATPTNYAYTGTTRSFSFDFGKKDWDAPDYVARLPNDNGDLNACLCVRHPLTGDVYYSRNGSNDWYRWTSTANRWDRLSSVARTLWYAGAAIDTKRNRMLVVGGYSAVAPMVLNLNGSTQQVTFGGLGASALTLSGGYPGVVYDESNDLYIVVFNADGNIKILTVRAGDLYVDSPTLSGPTPAARTNGIQNSVQYVPELKGIVIANNYYGDVYFMKTA